MGTKKDTITLGIEGTRLECNRNQLITNSDYFAAMLTGGFKESSLDYIEIQGIDLKTFNSILLMLWDHSYVMDDHDLHTILEGACMLQFESVRKMCEDRIQAVLKPSICLKIWQTAEMLQISPLWLKAKSMALEDFSDICQSKHIFEFDLNEICGYLGHIYLNTPNEMLVFQTAMNWWYENQDIYSVENATNVILRLLNCIDYGSLRDIDIKEMQTYPDLSDNEDIQSVLNCVDDLKTNGINVGEFPVESLIYAVHLCNSKMRRKPELACVLLQKCTEPVLNKKFKTDDAEDQYLIMDRYHRKRHYLKITGNPSMSINKNSNSTALCYDPEKDKFLTYSIVIEGKKIKELVGFKFLSNKEFVYFFGGEMIIGSRDFNRNVWSYDSFKEKWERIAAMPYDRRNFESVLVDDCIFIVGGVATYRVLQGNMFWYDMNTDKWSTLVPLPNQDRFFKCCSFFGQLCIVYLIGKCVYLFEKSQNSWTPIKMFIEDHVVSEMRHFSVCSIANKLYIKGKYLIILQFTGNSLILLKQMEMNEIDYEEMESTLCNHTIYTLYKRRDDNYDVVFSLESLDLKTKEVKYIFKNKVEGKAAVEADGQYFRPSEFTKLLSINHYGLVKDNVGVNDAIRM